MLKARQCFSGFCWCDRQLTFRDLVPMPSDQMNRDHRESHKTAQNNRMKPKPGVPNWIRNKAMPLSVTDQTQWRTSAPALCWAGRESGVLIGTGPQRLTYRHAKTKNERQNVIHDGFIAFEADAGRAPDLSGAGRPQRQPALPYISLQSALRFHPCRALSSAEARMSLPQVTRRSQLRRSITAQ